MPGRLVLDHPNRTLKTSESLLLEAGRAELPDVGLPDQENWRLDAASLQREIEDAHMLTVRPNQLLNSLAFCKMIYVDGRPRDWLHLYTNPAWEAQSGEAAATGRYASEMFPGIHELDPEILEIFGRVAAGGEPERFTRYLRSIGQWFEVQASCLRPGYFVAVFDVVTERVEQDDALQHAQRRLSLAQVVSKSGIWDWNVPFGTLHWTPELVELFGLDPSTTNPTFETWRAIVHPEDVAVAEERILAAIQKRTPLFNEYRIVWPDGQQRWIRAYGDTLYDAAGEPLRMLGLCLDVTDLKQLSRAAANAYAANLAKSSFLATMSHELRTPLNSVIGFTTLMLARAAGDITEEQERQLGIVQRSGQQLLELVTDILDIAKVEAGKIALNLETVPLKPLLTEQLEALRPMAEARNLRLETVECADGLAIQADPKRLCQVVRNLLSNSIKYTDRGAIRVRALEDDGAVHLQFEDTGIGMSRDEIDRLFTPFRRSENPASAVRGGSGLGLSISRSLVHAMGGSITVSSDPGRGSVFTVTLPASAAT